MLALWIRVRAVAAMQMDLFRHLLSLSMRFFTGQKTGELVSRLDTDTRAAAAGLDTIVGTALSADGPVPTPAELVDALLHGPEDGRARVAVGHGHARGSRRPRHHRRHRALR